MEKVPKIPEIQSKAFFMPNEAAKEQLEKMNFNIFTISFSFSSIVWEDTGIFCLQQTRNILLFLCSYTVGFFPLCPNIL